jgi:hypothetical protein
LPRPFEVTPDHLRDNLEEMVSAVFADLQSQFLVLPKGSNFVEYSDFQTGYEVLKRETSGFENFTEATVWAALKADAMSFLVLRSILGLSPPEWADLARSDLGVDVPQNAARDLDSRVRKERDHFLRLDSTRNEKTKERTGALVSVAIRYLTWPIDRVPEDMVHRLAKFDTLAGLGSLRHAASHHVPYAMLLYERYLGRPFASHRDAVSELVGDVMESAIEERLAHAQITFRKTRRAERIPGFEQAPDFIVPDEINPVVVIEAKITGDDGTARDKVTRIERLATMRDERIRAGQVGFQVLACIDGRGFGVRREDMRRMLLRTEGKIFTLATLDQMIQHTRLREFLPKKPAK